MQCYRPRRQEMPQHNCPSPHLNPLLCVSPSDFSSPSHFWNKCLPTCTSIDAAMVVVGRVIVAMARTPRYRRRRSGTSSTASSRGRIRVRVPVQQVVSLTVPANSIDSDVLTSSPFYRNSTTSPSCCRCCCQYAALCSVW